MSSLWLGRRGAHRLQSIASQADLRMPEPADQRLRRGLEPDLSRVGQHAAMGTAMERSAATRLMDSISLSRVGQLAAMGTATERSAATRPNDSLSPAGRAPRLLGHAAIGL